MLENNRKAFFDSLFRDFFNVHEAPLYKDSEVFAARNKFVSYYINRDNFGEDYSALLNGRDNIRRLERELLQTDSSSLRPFEEVMTDPDICVWYKAFRRADKDKDRLQFDYTQGYKDHGCDKCEGELLEAICYRTVPIQNGIAGYKTR